ncbi:NfeD family protein [Sorangium sp. So ce1014]|uniref:NfeD family protein n=1 Tax=Sorangium sp. So ce1014 TaxID=3133326 RepID=UPI003F640740
MNLGSAASAAPPSQGVGLTGLWRLLEQAARRARLAIPLLALLATMALCRPARGDAAPAPAAGAGAAGAPAPPGPRPLPPIPGAGKVTVVAIAGAIDLGLSPFLERVLAAQGEGDLLVLDISTLGGRIDAALAIRDALLRARARTVCWVNPRAISAGALISLACDVIAVAPGATLGAATPVQLGEGGEMKPVAEKIVSYMRKEMRATAEAKGRRGDIAEAMVDADAEVPGLDEKGKLLTLDGAQALAWGVAEVQAGSEAELFGALGRPPPGEIARPRPSFAEELARFLSDPTLSGILMTLGMLGILLELYAPGHGVSLAVGLSCLALFFFGHHVVKLAGWEEIALFVAGAILIAVEILAPGHVVPGVVGAGCVALALLLALLDLERVPLDIAWHAGWLPRALATASVSLAATAALAVVAARVAPRTRLGRRLVLDTAIRAVATEGPSGSSAAPASLASAVGRVVTADTDLRPSGKVSLDGRRVEALSELGYVEAGARVRVIRADAGRLVVRAIAGGSGEEAGA